MSFKEIKFEIKIAFLIILFIGLVYVACEYGWVGKVVRSVDKDGIPFNEQIENQLSNINPIHITKSGNYTVRITTSSDEEWESPADELTATFQPKNEWISAIGKVIGYKGKMRTEVRINGTFESEIYEENEFQIQNITKEQN